MVNFIFAYVNLHLYESDDDKEHNIIVFPSKDFVKQQIIKTEESMIDSFSKMN